MHSRHTRSAHCKYVSSLTSSHCHHIVLHSQAEEEDARAELRAATRDENLTLAEEKAAREAAWRAMQAEADAKELAARETALRENMGHQFDPATGRIQKDRFRGLSAEQRMEILKENERLCADHAARAAADAQRVSQPDHINVNTLRPSAACHTGC